MEKKRTPGVYKVVTQRHVDGKGGHTHTVHYYKHVCSCGKWQMYRLPCSHALDVCRRRYDNPHDIVHQVHHTRTFFDQYSGKFVPMAHSDYWSDPGWKLQPNPTCFVSQRRGRIRASRIRNEQDERDPDKPRRCSICHQIGHN